MTAAVALLPTIPAESLLSRTGWSLRNALVLARRGVVRMVREPSQLLDVTVQPVIFILLFVYVFGSAIKIPGDGNYHEYLIGGMFGMALVGTAQGTAVGVSTDMATGLVDRFRSLPIARSSVLAGRVLADLLTEVLAVAVLVITGLAVGWRTHDGLADALLAFGLCLLIAFAMTWVFVSNTFVPTQGMPSWLQVVANWNPVSAVASACRHLFGNPNPASAISAWPMQHPELATILWSIGLTLVFAPLAVYFYRQKSSR